MNVSDDNRLSTVLDYPDDLPALDVGEIVRAGRRRRSRRRATIAGASAATLAVTAGVGAAVGIGSSPARSPEAAHTIGPRPPWLPATVTQSNDLLAAYPPSPGSVRTLARNADGWRAVAYVDADGELCFGSVEPFGPARGACSPTDAFGDAPLVDNAVGPGESAAATAPESEAPEPEEIGVFGMVSTGASEPGRIQPITKVKVSSGLFRIAATLSPTAAAMGSESRLARGERVWFAWLPTTLLHAPLRVWSYNTAGETTGSQPLWITPREFG